MTLVLRPRACPGDRLHVWVAALQRTAAPTLAWTIDGVPTTARPVRPMTSARPPGLVDDDEARAFTGVFEIARDGDGAPIRPGTRHTIGATTSDGEVAWPLPVQAMPAEVPQELDGRFTIMLVSCFHAARDRAGIAGQVVASLLPGQRPDLTLLLGDQVYLDLPTLSDFPDDARWLARRFEERYLANWVGDPTANGAPTGYAHLLAAAPTIAIPDDHDFWNNFPHPAAQVENTYSPAGRERWHAAALAMYEAFQMPAPGALGSLTTLDVPPLSIACLDARSQRRTDRSRTSDPAAIAALRAWARLVADADAFGILATGQSLYDPKRSKLAGTFGDFTMPNYGDYGAILDGVLALTARGRPATCVTGDVHWGRVTATRDAATGRPMIHEVISSPTSLVETIGVDNVKGLGAAVKGLFDKKPDWPLHGDPHAPPAFFDDAGQRAGRKLANDMLHGQKGNQIALVAFSRAGSALQMNVTYLPLHPDSRKRDPVPVWPPIVLKPTPDQA